MDTLVINKKMAVIIIISLSMCIGVGMFFFNENEEKSDNSGLDKQTITEIVFNVKTDVVKSGDLCESILSNGHLKAENELNLVSNITGNISQLYIWEAKKVTKGDLLVKLEDDEQKIALDEAEVALMKAKNEYVFMRKGMLANETGPKVDSINKELEKNEGQFRRGELTEDKYLKKKEELDIELLFVGAKRNEVVLNKSGLQSAINTKNRAKLFLSYTEIIAPFSGVIADFSLTKKQRVLSGESLFKILSTDRYKIEVGVIESEIVKIKKDNKVIISINAIPNLTLLGKIVSINPCINQETKTYRVLIDVQTTDPRIKSGMFAIVSLETEVYRNCMLIPKDALLVRNKKNVVIIVVNNTAKVQEVLLGHQNEKYFEVLQGLKLGDTVIVDGHYNIAHGAKIKNVIEK